MSIKVKVPELPESVSDGVVVGWHKQPGDTITRDEALVDIETDKVVLEVPAPQDGILEKILLNDGDTVVAQQVMGLITPGGTQKPAAVDATVETVTDEDSSQPSTGASGMGPAVRKLVAEHALDPESIHGSGRDGRVTKADVLEFLKNRRAAAQPTEVKTPGPPAVTPGLPEIGEDRPQKRVPISRLRARIAERLLHATQSTAMLTTFNEVNMQPVMEIRDRYKDEFEKVHGVRLGFMSFFVRASAEALKRYPDINASIDGDDIVYHGFCDIGVAISSDRGLVVPILRNAEYMSLAEIETYIMEFANKARDSKLEMEDITGGTFTISNGGVFGSMLSTPILNPPQSAILGMHKIQDRPVAEDGQVVIRPIMYLALTYDHRIVDGKSAVTFLAAIKELLEDPASMLLDI
ncbi:MAG: 2-oxoglutarate dehydrogenase complex dihydrolipoyllysine-residue succinyltransferase [Gammaproteobacteria bacterium]|nr:MAG: 2-oxoglutarate dehydrogenase complex dihydrolipoyllysine-residue succinyltransferase [Gammaproteobacteria bacterium]